MQQTKNVASMCSCWTRGRGGKTLGPWLVYSIGNGLIKNLNVAGVVQGDSPATSG